VTTIENERLFGDFRSEFQTQVLENKQKQTHIWHYHLSHSPRHSRVVKSANETFCTGPVASVTRQTDDFWYSKYYRIRTTAAAPPTTTKTDVTSRNLRLTTTLFTKIRCINKNKNYYVCIRLHFALGLHGSPRFYVTLDFTLSIN